MFFLHRIKKGLNANALNESDYSLLDYEQLLNVNGAGGGGSSGGGGPSGPSSTPTNTSSTTSSPSSSSSGKGSSQKGPSGGNTTDTTTTTTNDNSDTTTTDKSNESKYVENSNEGVAGAKPGDKIVRKDGTEVTLTQADIDWAKKQVGDTSSSNKTEESGNNNTDNKNNDSSTANNNTTTKKDDSSSNNNPTQTTNKTATDKIENAISDVGKKDYVKGKEGYMCDDYVKEVIEKAGYDSKKYFVDDPSGKDVNKHISELESSGKQNYKTDASTLGAGTYVVFMSDNEKGKDSHAAILVVNKDGSAYMQDNSSHNNVTKRDAAGKAIEWAGGTEKTPGNSASSVCALYTGYDNFYFQELKN